MTIYHKHHIIPRHMGGSDDPSNLVKLTVEEHAKAHKKLYEEFGKVEDLIAWKALSGQITSEEARRRAVSSALTGKKQTPEQIKKRVESRLKTCPAPTLGKKFGPASEERKLKISKANRGNTARLGFKTSEETKIKQSKAAKNRELFECPKCGARMQKANLVRYHGLDGKRCS